MIAQNVATQTHMVGIDSGGRELRGLGVYADSRGLTALRYGVLDRPDRPIEPFRLQHIHLNLAYSAVMEEVILQRVEGRIWEKTLLDEVSRGEYPCISWGFIARDGEEKPHQVADLSYLSDHYYKVAIRLPDLDGVEVGISPFSFARRYADIFCGVVNVLRMAVFDIFFTQYCLLA